LAKGLDLNLKRNRVKVCKDCLKDAVEKNQKAKQNPPPENWNAEVWLCYRLRERGECPLGLPSISPLFFYKSHR